MAGNQETAMVDDSIKQGVQQVAQDLYEKHGKLTPSMLVEAAKPKDSPAHGGFEWDDKKAGREYRLWQARGWYKRIQILREAASEPEPLVNVPRVLAQDDDRREGEYQVLSVVVERPDEFSRALEQAQAKLAAAKRAIDELLRAAERGEKTDQVAIIAQMARAAELWADALSAMH
jgi:hypothetical protein